jgi:hypothetical protein
MYRRALARAGSLALKECSSEGVIFSNSQARKFLGDNAPALVLPAFQKSAFDRRPSSPLSVRGFSANAEPAKREDDFSGEWFESQDNAMGGMVGRRRREGNVILLSLSPLPGTGEGFCSSSPL